MQPYGYKSFGITPRITYLKRAGKYKILLLSEKLLEEIPPKMGSYRKQPE